MNTAKHQKVLSLVRELLSPPPRDGAMVRLKPNERGQWRRANCTLCGGKIEIDYDDRATELLHRLNEHSCSSVSGGTVTG